VRFRIDHDAVAVGDERDRATVDRFRRDVAHAETVGAARETPVGDERRVGAPADPLHRAGDGEHLLHPGPALRALVADHHDVAGVDVTGEHRLHRKLLAVVDARRPVESQLVEPGHLHHAALRRERAGEDREPTLGVDRCRQRMHDVAVGRGRVECREVLGHRLAADRHTVAVQQPGVEQLAHHDLHAADAVEVGHVVLAVRLHVGDVRNLRPDAIEVVELELDVCFVRDCQQVQHEVRRPAERHADRDGVLERLLGEDLARPDAGLEEAHHRSSGLESEVVAASVDGRRGGAAGQRHAERLGGRRHGVGGEHAGARTDRRARLPLDLTELVLGERARGARSDPLEHVHEVDRLTLVAAGQDRAAVQEHRREVETSRGHEHAGKALVAAGERDERVKAFRVHDALDRVGDDLP